MDRYIAALIDTINRGEAIYELIRPAPRIHQAIALYQDR